MITGLNREKLDKFYTKNEIVNLCIKEIKKYSIIENDDLIIEPSCGNGAFVEGIKSLSSNFLFIDIEPDYIEAQKADYLNLNNPLDSKVHLIGNPPFGRQSSLAIKFIRKSVEFCDSISFILPKSFKKESMKKYFPLNFHLISQIDLPKESFLIKKNEIISSYDVPCVFRFGLKKILIDRVLINLNLMGLCL